MSLDTLDGAHAWVKTNPIKAEQYGSAVVAVIRNHKGEDACLANLWRWSRLQLYLLIAVVEWECDRDGGRLVRVPVGRVVKGHDEYDTVYAVVADLS